jgi:hypothetical protein
MKISLKGGSREVVFLLPNNETYSKHFEDYKMVD